MKFTGHALGLSAESLQDSRRMSSILIRSTGGDGNGR
jgi:hypothetical protein